MNNPKCTYCGGTKFYEGPSGGMSQNILCANEKCRHWFNATPFGIEDLKRVEPTDAEKGQEAEKRKAEAVDARLARYNDGRKAFEDGKPMGSLRTAYSYGGYSEASDNIDRICGFIDALSEQVRGTPRGFTITDDPDAIMGKVQR
jgi:hypothetical protein